MSTKRMELETENALNELVLQFHLRVNTALKRKGLRLIKMTHVQLEDASTDAESFQYPACVHFNLEAWNTHKLTLTLDGRLIREGSDLSAKGIDQRRYILGIVNEMTDWTERCALYASLKANEVVFNGYKVRVIGDKAWQGRECTYEIRLLNGKTSKWYGRSADDALSNASPWLKTKVKSISLKAVSRG